MEEEKDNGPNSAKKPLLYLDINLEQSMEDYWFIDIKFVLNLLNVVHR